MTRCAPSSPLCSHAALLGLALLALAAGPRPAQAQLKEETLTRSIDVARLKILAEEKIKHEVDSFEGRYRYQIACHRRLLRLEAQIRSCVDTQRLVDGEFHTRLDFTLTPDGKVKSFATRHEQLQACLLPKMLTRTFPAFSSKRPSYLLIVLVASPGCRLGRRVKAAPVAVYPIGSPEELSAYKQAAGWVVGPWSQTIGTCLELVDRTLGLGYRARFSTELSPAGRAVRSTLELKGKMPGPAADQLVRCAAPFLKGMRAPRHAGPGNVVFIHGSSSARWGQD